MGQYILTAALINFIPGIVLWIWEVILPDRKIKYASVIGEAVTLAGSTFLFNVFLHSMSHLDIFLPAQRFLEVSGFESIPLLLRLVLAFLAVDLTYYFMHRAYHSNRFLWNAHKLHHSAEQLWWLSGLRGSFINVCLNKVPFHLFAVFNFPAEIILAVAIITSLDITWMHLNIKGKKWMKFVELFLVTPKYHNIHHVSDPELQNKNLGSYFTFWDRLFGTYLDPDSLNIDEKQYGLGEGQSITGRMIVGI